MGFEYRTTPGYILANPTIRLLLDRQHEEWHVADDIATKLVQKLESELLEIPIDKTETVLIDLETDTSKFVTNPISEIEKGVIDVDVKLVEKVKEAIDATEEPTESIFKNYSGVINRTTFNVLELIDLVQAGVLNLADLPPVVVQSIITNIDFSLSFLQNSNLANISKLNSAILKATVLSGQGIIDIVAEGANAIIDAITKSIDKALDEIERLILDPIAKLLQAILDAIKGLPDLAFDVFVRRLLEEIPSSRTPT